MSGRDGWVPDRLWLRVPTKTEDMPGADAWFRYLVTHAAAQSGGRVLIGPPLRKEDPVSAQFDCVTYAYPAERPDPYYRQPVEKIDFVNEW